MGQVRCQISVSVDGYVAGPSQSEEHPLGEGGESLHEWVFKLEPWQRAHGRSGGEKVGENPSAAVVEEAQSGVGAVVMGRNMFGPVRGPWGDTEWRGWWGEEPPFRTPVYVLTHHDRDPLEMDGGTSFHFVTEGIESAVSQAKDAAGDDDVAVGGGGATIQQCLAAGLLDELLVNLVPVLLGDGTRLFDNLAPGTVELQLEELIEGPEVAHLRYRVGDTAGAV